MTLDALIVTDAAATSIASINATQTVRVLVPVLAADGRKVLSASLLTDCGHGQTWEAYGAILATLARANVAMPEGASE